MKTTNIKPTGMKTNKEIIQEIENKQFHSKRGSIILSRIMLNKMGEKEFKALFSVFFPLHIEHHNYFDFGDRIMYVGYSPLFEPLKEGELIPIYEVKMNVEILNEERLVSVSMIKIITNTNDKRDF